MTDSNMTTRSTAPRSSPICPGPAKRTAASTRDAYCSSVAIADDATNQPADRQQCVVQPYALCISDAVFYYGFSRSTFYRRLRAGDFEARKVGRRTLVLVASLQAFIESLPSAFPR
jgi:predicted DNA-binding transcriptional regulator AlpA